MRISYYQRPFISLSLEDYYNAGVTPEQAKKELESITVFDGFRHDPTLCVEPAGINENWGFWLPAGASADDIVWQLEWRLQALLAERSDDEGKRGRGRWMRFTQGMP